MTEPRWVELQARANVYNWELDERREANINDSEIAGLINAGLLVIVDEATRASLPPPAAKSGCGCGR